MKIQEMQEILNIPDSTLGDWDNNPKRRKLMKLLRALKKEDALKLLQEENFTPKYSPLTRKIKLNKSLFHKDLLFSREDGSPIEIDTLIATYLKTPNQKDTNTLLYIFGAARLKKVLEKIKSYIDMKDYDEAQEQIEYAIDKNSFIEKHSNLININTALTDPKERYIEPLLQKYSKEQLLDMASANSLSYGRLFKLKKLLSEHA